MNKITITSEELNKIQEIELNILKEIDRICRKNNLKYFLAYGTLIGAVRHKGFIPWDDDVDIYMNRKDYVKFKELCKTELDEKYFYQCNETDPQYYYLFDKVRANNTVFKEDKLAAYDINHGLYIDIFPVDFMPKNKFKRMGWYFKYHFCRSGLIAKYPGLNTRQGKKLVGAIILRVLYFPFTKKFLYKNAVATAGKYMNEKSKDVYCSCNAFIHKEFYPAKYFNEVEEVQFEDMKCMSSKYNHKILTQFYGDYMQLPPEEKRVHKHELVEFKI